MNGSVLEFQDIWKSFGQDEIKTDALKDVNFKIKKNTINLILGPSGSGKSTLLNLVSLLDTPTKGKIIINGKNTSKMSESERNIVRRNEIGIVYQRGNLFPYLNLLENVMIPMIKQNKEKAVKTLKTVCLDEINKFPDEVSILENQKATLARAVINDPSILVTDEPTGELNSENREKMMKLIKDIGNNCTVLIASNNPDLGIYCDDIFYLQDGILNQKRIKGE